MPIGHFPASTLPLRATTVRGGPRLPSAAVLQALVRRERLDRELARGTHPARSAALEVRARQLGSPRSRRSLAVALEDAVAIARGARRASSAMPRLAQAEIRTAAPEMLELARELRTAPEVAAEGVARARLLVTDGLGPLYVCERPGELAEHTREALRAIRGR